MIWVTTIFSKISKISFVEELFSAVERCFWQLENVFGRITATIPVTKPMGAFYIVKVAT